MCRQALDHLRKIATFINWSLQVSALLLARANFEYTGQQDTVSCPDCGLRLSDWTRDKDPMKEHRTRSPNCSFFQKCPDANCQQSLLDLQNSLHTVKGTESRQHRTSYTGSSSAENNSNFSRSSSHAVTAAATATANEGSRDPATIARVYTPSPSSSVVEFFEAAASNNNGFTTASAANAAARQPAHEAGHSASEVISNTNTQTVPLIVTSSMSTNVPQAASNITFNSATNNPRRLNLTDADFQNFKTEAIRRETFLSWPATARADPESLARAGLFYTGLDDRVQCAFCRGILFNWIKEDVPHQAHEKHFPQCPFVRKIELGSQINANVAASSALTRAAFVGAGNARMSSESETEGVARSEGASAAAGTREHKKKSKAASKRKSSENLSANESLRQEAVLVDEEEQHLLEENAHLRAARACKICMDQDIDTVFLPCGHLVSCADCAKNITHCAVCRVLIRGTVKAFLS